MGKKQNQPLVSVIIPTYNYGRYIKECLDSVLAQVHLGKNIFVEIIVVDDGSTDDTHKLVSEYGSLVNYQKIDKSGGPARPRNVGISIARGKYIAFLDADDVWDPNKLSEQLTFMEGSPELVLSSTNARMIEPDGRQTNRPVVEEQYIPEDYTFEELLKVNFLSTSGIMVRSKVFDEVRFNELLKLRAPEDYELWLRIAAKGAIGLINKPLVGYRIHNAKISEADGLLAEKRLIIVYKSLAASPLNAKQKKMVDRQLINHYRSLASYSGTIKGLLFRGVAAYFALRAKLIYT